MPKFWWVPSIYAATYATFWIKSDAKSFGHSVPHIVQMFVLSLWSILISAYLILKRGFRGFLWSLLHGVAIPVTYLFGLIFEEFAPIKFVSIFGLR